MRVKILVVIAMARVQGEIGGRITPSGVRHVNEHISGPRGPMAYLRRNGGIVSLPEPDLNAIISGFRHDVVSTTILVKWCAVGGATVGEADTTPLVEVDQCVAVVAEGGPAASFFVYGESQGPSSHPSGRETHPVCGRLPPWGKIVHPGAVCNVAWFLAFKLTPVRDEAHA